MRVAQGRDALSCDPIRLAAEEESCNKFEINDRFKPILQRQYSELSGPHNLPIGRDLLN